MSSRLKSDKEIDSDILTIQEELKGKSKWQQYLIVDLLTVRQFSLKSMIDNEQKKVVEKKIETLYKMIQKSNMIKVDQMEREIKPEDYYFIMNYVGNTLEDDHSHINLQQFMQTQ